jgi:hypothetical protein
MNAILEKLPALVQEELDAANLAFAAFASLHEGYAVLLEEAEEAWEEMNGLNTLLHDLWQSIRRDEAPIAGVAASAIERHALNLAAEAIQVAAMARKFQAILKEEKA